MEKDLSFNKDIGSYCSRQWIGNMKENTEKKIRFLEEVMELEEGTLNEDMILSDYEEWDSLSIISYIALMDSRFHKTISIDEIKKFVTVKDAIDKI